MANPLINSGDAVLVVYGWRGIKALARWLCGMGPHGHTIQDVCCLLDAEGMLARCMLLAGIAV